MRASLLAAVVAAVLAVAGPASAQNTYGGQSGSSTSALPSYANRGGNLTSNTHWASKITSWIPTFRSPTTPGTLTGWPNPDTDGRAYMATFGFRRMR